MRSGEPANPYQATHHRGQRHGSGAHQQKNVTGDQCLRVQADVGALEEGREPFQEVRAIAIGAEEGPTLNPPGDDMVQGAGSIEARAARPARMIRNKELSYTHSNAHPR
jgi:hypothetical protein